MPSHKRESTSRSENGEQYIFGTLLTLNLSLVLRFLLISNIISSQPKFKNSMVWNEAWFIRSFLEFWFSLDSNNFMFNQTLNGNHVDGW